VEVDENGFSPKFIPHLNPGAWRPGFSICRKALTAEDAEDGEGKALFL
jgi:hypothetical protein